jgi:hypothetical protein
MAKDTASRCLNISFSMSTLLATTSWHSASFLYLPAATRTRDSSSSPAINQSINLRLEKTNWRVSSQNENEQTMNKRRGTMKRKIVETIDACNKKQRQKITRTGMVEERGQCGVHLSVINRRKRRRILSSWWGIEMTPETTERRLVKRAPRLFHVATTDNTEHHLASRQKSGGGSAGRPKPKHINKTYCLWLRFCTHLAAGRPALKANPFLKWKFLLRFDEWLSCM